MEPILEMAKDLAYAIQQDERYIRTQMAQAAADEASLIDATGTGYEFSAAYLDREQSVVRLFNADGDGTPQKIRFAFPLSKVEQTDLNGNATAACAIRKRGGVSEIEVAMPRFGLKTLRLTK